MNLTNQHTEAQIISDIYGIRVEVISGYDSRQCKNVFRVRVYDFDGGEYLPTELTCKDIHAALREAHRICN